MFYFSNVKGRKVLKSDFLNDVEHFFTTRELCLFAKEDDMSDNRKLVENYLGQKMATNQPVHGTHIATVENNKFFYSQTDGLLISKGQAAFMNFGDCVPIIFYVNNMGVIAHAGWRGTVQCMAKVAVEKLIREYGIKAQDIKAVIGPAICSKCYEVGQDVFAQLYKTVANHFEGFYHKDNKYFVGLKDINKQQLLECGVDQIDVCPYCTACGEKLFYSYRFEKTGYRHSAVLKL